MSVARTARPNEPRSEEGQLFDAFATAADALISHVLAKRGLSLASMTNASDVALVFRPLARVGSLGIDCDDAGFRAVVELS